MRNIVAILVVLMLCGTGCMQATGHSGRETSPTISGVPLKAEVIARFHEDNQNYITRHFYTFNRNFTSVDVITNEPSGTFKYTQTGNTFSKSVIKKNPTIDQIPSIYNHDILYLILASICPDKSQLLGQQPVYQQTKILGRLYEAASIDLSGNKAIHLYRPAHSDNIDRVLLEKSNGNMDLISHCNNFRYIDAASTYLWTKLDIYQTDDGGKTLIPLLQIELSFLNKE